MVTHPQRYSSPEQHPHSYLYFYPRHDGHIYAHFDGDDYSPLGNEHSHRHALHPDDYPH
jgi:hypothetical protein